MIGSAMKYWGMSYNEVMHGVSFQNLMMLNATVPTYESKDSQPNKTMSFFDLGEKIAGQG